MAAVELAHLVKCYGDRPVVDDLSLRIDRGEVYGLIGPNGAGKTTTIRMMTGMIRPDSGEVTLFGETVGEASKNRIGYLPEERGLYRKLSVIDCIVYLASLKGMDRQSAVAKGTSLLERMGMLAHKDKKVEALSHGMAQIVQFVVTIVHDPALVILDEPFSALDPVNAEHLTSMIVEMRNQGKAVVLSTHRMNEVEELCDRIVMINQGRAVLNGTLSEIKSRYKWDSIILEPVSELGVIPGVLETHLLPGHLELVLDEKTTPRQVLSHLLSRGVEISRFELARPTLHDIFVQVVEKSRE